MNSESLAMRDLYFCLLSCLLLSSCCEPGSSRKTVCTADPRSSHTPASPYWMLPVNSKSLSLSLSYHLPVSPVSGRKTRFFHPIGVPAKQRKVVVFLQDIFLVSFSAPNCSDSAPELGVCWAYENISWNSLKTGREGAEQYLNKFQHLILHKFKMRCFDFSEVEIKISSE